MNEYARKIRRELHQHPGIGFELDETLSILRRELDSIGVEYTEKYGKSSIVATVNPEKSHYTIAIRADIDALPITEMCDVEYKSLNEGKMHACGHDAHAAMALAALKEIYEMREKISCRVKFIFQACEEAPPSGAMLMVRDGVMDEIDEIIAIHVDTDIDVGAVGVISGYRNATSDGFLIDFYGKSAHVAYQQYGADAIIMAVRAISDIEFVIAKETSAREPIIFNVGAIHGGETNNVICNHVQLNCTLRTHTDQTAEYVFSKIKSICNAVAETAGGRFELTRTKHYPVVYNNPEICQRLKKVASSLLGEDKIFEKRRGLGGEDFSYFANEKPGCMIQLGVRNEERGITHGLHTNLFDIDERALEVGTKIFVNYILENMK